MKNPEAWQPTKFVYRKGRLEASRDPRIVSVGSRLLADITAQCFQRYLPRYARGRLADLGCGKVPLYHAYRDLVTETVCIDWSDTLHPNAFLDHECDLSQPLPLADGEFDTIILSDVLEHLPQPELLWREMSRILADRGVILMTVPFYYCVHEAPHDYYRYTEFALRRFADISGLTIEVLTPTGGTPEVLTDILAKHLQFVPWVGKGSAAVLQAVTRWFVGLSLGKRLSRKTAQAFPFG